MSAIQIERKITQNFSRARAHFREKCGKIDTLIVSVDLTHCMWSYFG